ncbi:epimerase [Actibacterium lipolyticum]|uniref:NmrA-like family protein n=1 Tax=Actibacterium lipolyticum TaxID=1524263 RepID=A0A238KVB5_9RHOB|nr:epimerase [Actibacterium lipolyticum]SMX46580.1 NmrA-like family protein [Actibacterium lipolyticum]
MKPIVLILGGSGRFGRHMTNVFSKAGWDVRQFNRKTDNMWDAAWGAQVIVHGWNPPYPQWAAEVPDMTSQIIEVASASGATVLIPGNVYVFGQDAPDQFDEHTPHLATNPLGQVRRDMEDAFRASGVRCILLRAGDFIDDRPSGNWFDMIITKSLQKGRFVYPGPTDMPHAWAYLPDFARAAFALIEKRETLATFEDVPFPGYTLTGAQLAKGAQQAVGHPVRTCCMKWLPISVIKPFWPMAKYILEMRYLWSKPHYLDGTRFAQLLPEFQHTPLDTALTSALQHHVQPDQAVA